jgi:hypothetical protein
LANAGLNVIRALIGQSPHPSVARHAASNVFIRVVQTKKGSILVLFTIK